jgi:hypothetical protein
VLPRSALDEQRGASHGFECAYGGVDTAGDYPACALIQFFGMGVLGHLGTLEWVALTRRVI